MNKDMAISVNKLSKMYKIYREPKDLLKEILFQRNYHDEFWALKDIDFDIKKGEVVGIIGRNGAGKSTLLKILSGTLDKTSGSISIDGKVSAILELGTGFHPEYTGRENIYNGGMILGMSKKEINKKIDSIIEFSELGEFIDRPFKTYSTGMQVRLSFSVATAINPEILIIDEALAAGDSFFVNKCIQRITDLCQSGATVLFVSHNTFLVQRLCNRAILLEKGKIKSDGNPVEVCQEYELTVTQDLNKKLIIDSSKNDRKVIGEGPLRIKEVSFMNQKKNKCYRFNQGDYMSMKVEYETPKAIKNPGLFIMFTKSDGIYATSYFSGEDETFHKKENFGTVNGRGELEVVWEKILLGDGVFYVTVGIFPETDRRRSVMRVDPYCLHDKAYKIEVKRPLRPLQTLFDQEVTISHRKENE